MPFRIFIPFKQTCIRAFLAFRANVHLDNIRENYFGANVIQTSVFRELVVDPYDNIVHPLVMRGVREYNHMAVWGGGCESEI